MDLASLHINMDFDHFDWWVCCCLMVSQKSCVCKSLTDYIGMNLSQLWPVTMLMRLYSITVLFIDLSYFVLYTWIEIFLAVYHIFKPAARKEIGSEVVVIVGAARGIGRELCLELALLGAEVVCIDVNSVGNESTVKRIRIQKGKAHAYTCDVTNREAVMRTVRVIEKDIGPISILIHCCGVPSPRSYTTEAPPIQNTLNIGIVSHFWLVESILPKMKLRRHGHVVLLTSVAGIKNQMALSVSQFAVQGLFKSLTENIRLDRLQDDVVVSLVHLYPFIVSRDLAHDIGLRIPNLFGTADARQVAIQIIDAFLRNETEISIPKHVLYLGHIMRLLPKRATLMLREILDTGLDFG